ncbi:MAG TPA: hypothetical protein VGK70_09945 [Thermoanaerobaculia bacterium]
MSSRSTAPTACAFALALLALPGLAAGQSLRVTAGTIEDRRTTGKFFGGLEIELKLTGDDLADAKAARVLLKKAVDESGRDLLPEKRGDEDFQKSSGSGAPDLKVNLKNPARGAAAIKEVSGDVELYAPSRDPAATVLVDRLTSRMDKSIDSAALKAQKIGVRLVSPKVYRADAKKREAEMDAEMEKHKDEMKKEAGDDKTAEALMALVKGFSGMMNDVGDNDVILQIEDEGGRLQDVEVVGQSGVIDTRGSMSSGGLKILQYSEKLPPDAKLRFLLKTKKSLLKTPFMLTNVPLP